MDRTYTILRYNPGTFLGEPFYDWRGRLFEELARHLSSRGMRVRVEERSSFRVRRSRFETRRIPILDSLAILQNDRTGEYCVLDCHDWTVTKELDLLAGDAGCKRILKCQYRPTAFAGPRYRKVRRWTYFDRFWPEKEHAIVADRATPRTSDALYFRGSDWGPRDRILQELGDREVISGDRRAIEFDAYFRESARHRVMLSLPGIADVCNRDVECFGRGVCVLRPRLRAELHHGLIPDHHYVSVDVHVGRADPVEVADAIARRFRDVAGDHAYLDAVARNAAQWYDENVRVGAAMSLTARLLA